MYQQAEASCLMRYHYYLIAYIHAPHCTSAAGHAWPCYDSVLATRRGGPVQAIKARVNQPLKRAGFFPF